MFDTSAYVTLNVPIDICIYRYLCAHLWILERGEKLAAFLGPVLYRVGNSVCLFIVQHLVMKDLSPHKICYYSSNK